MKAVKLAIFSFVFLFIVVWLISLLIPSEVRVSRATDLAAEKDSIMDLIADVNRWKEWYPNMDAADKTRPLVKERKATGIILDETDPDKLVYMELDKVTGDEVTAWFVGNRIKPVRNSWKILEHPGSNTLTLQWTMDFSLRWYPWEKFASLVLEKSNGARMEAGLSNIKKKLAVDLSSNN